MPGGAGMVGVESAFSKLQDKAINSRETTAEKAADLWMPSKNKEADWHRQKQFYAISV